MRNGGVTGGARSHSQAYTGRREGRGHCSPRIRRKRPPQTQAQLYQEVPGGRGASSCLLRWRHVFRLHVIHLVISPLQEYKSAAAAAASMPLPPTSPLDNVASSSKPLNPQNGGTRPLVTGPQPLRPLDRRPSQSVHRARSPSTSATSTALQDLAHQGKRQLNQLMTFLDRDGARSDNALRQVRTKREADEAG